MLSGEIICAISQETLKNTASGKRVFGRIFCHLITRIAMQAMRHSEESLTTKVYTDKVRPPIAECINSLPAMLLRRCHV